VSRIFLSHSSANNAAHSLDEPPVSGPVAIARDLSTNYRLMAPFLDSANVTSRGAETFGGNARTQSFLVAAVRMCDSHRVLFRQLQLKSDVHEPSLSRHAATATHPSGAPYSVRRECRIRRVLWASNGQPGLMSA